jgi:hypothetical protein
VTTPLDSSARAAASRPGVTLRRRLAAVSALVLALGGFAPSVAQADDDAPITPFSSSQCASGRFCIWSATGYSGTFWSTGSAGDQNTTVATARSVWNRTGVAVRMYSGSGTTGVWVCYDAGDISSSTSIGSASVRTMTTSSC